MAFEIHKYPLVIREHHLDSYRHVNNATYVEIFEEARWEFVTKNGYGFDRVHELKIGPVVLAMEIQFRAELTNREKVIIETQTLEYKGKIGKLQQTITKENGELACSAIFTFGLFDMNRRKLILPTEEWKAAIGHLEE